jgi:hypothetical protein
MKTITSQQLYRRYTPAKLIGYINSAERSHGILVEECVSLSLGIWSAVATMRVIQFHELWLMRCNQTPNHLRIKVRRSALPAQPG